MADKTKAEIEKDLQDRETDLKLKNKEIADLKAKMKEITALKDKLLNGELPGRFKNSYKVQPPRPLNDLAEIEYHKWRVDEISARLENKHLAKDQRKALEETVYKEKRKFIHFFTLTQEANPKLAAEFQKTFDQYVREAPAPKTKV